MGIISDWVNRQRHNRGYGVQSPSEFFFVTQVLKEHLPYYAYAYLETIAEEEKCNKKHLKDLFRITNHHGPSNCIAIGSAPAACAISTARPSVEKYCITDHAINKETSEILAHYNCKALEGKTTELLEAALKELGGVGMVYIGKCNEYAELLETALRYTNGKSIIVVEGIRRNKEVQEWWKSIIESTETVVTYDLHSYGLLYFNRERRKQHYTLKR